MGAHGILFLPYMLGERAPFKSSNARGVFFGIDNNGKAMLLGCVLLQDESCRSFTWALQVCCIRFIVIVMIGVHIWCGYSHCLSFILDRLLFVS